METNDYRYGLLDAEELEETVLEEDDDDDDEKEEKKEEKVDEDLAV